MSEYVDFYCWKWGFWLWVFGIMFHVKYDPNHVPLFSERNGYVWTYRIWHLVIKVNRRK